MVNCFTVIKSLDMFGRPVCLKYQSRDYFQTIVGGVSTLFLIVFLIIYSRNGLLNVLQRQNISYEMITNKSNDPSFLQLNQGQFIFAIRLQQTNYLKNPFLNLTVIQTNQTIDNNGKSNRTITLLKMEPCTAQHWQNFIDPQDGDINTIMKRYNLDDALCPSQSNNISVIGNFFNTKFNYLRLSYSTCVGDQTICKTESELNAQIGSLGYLRAQLFFPSIVINPSQEKYTQKSIDDSFHFTFIPNTNVVSSDIFIQKSIIKTDNSLIIKSDSNDVKSEEFLHMENRFNTEYQQGKKNGYHAVFFLRRGADTFTYERSFKSIQSFLSELGGIAQVFISALSISFFLFYGILFKLSLINELYDVDIKNQKYVNEEKGKVDISSDTQQNIVIETQKNLISKEESIPSPLKNTFSRELLFPNEQDKDFHIKINQSQALGLFDSNKNEQEYGNQYQINKAQQFNNNVSHQKSKINQREESDTIENTLFSPKKSQENQEKTNQLWVKFNYMINQYVKVTISFKYLLYELTCKRYFKDNLFPLISKSLVHINQDLDISTILYKLQEIEKLKTVLLNDNQRNLFSFFPKPLIKLQEPLERKQSIHTSPKHFLNIWKSKIQGDMKYSNRSIETPSNKFLRKASMKKEYTQKQHLFTTPKHFTELDSFRILHQSYQQILESQDTSPSNQMTNDRLIACLGTDLLDIFKIQNNDINTSSRFTSLKNTNRSTFTKHIQQLNKMRLFKIDSAQISDRALSIQDEESTNQKDIKCIENIYAKEIKPNELTTITTNQQKTTSQINLNVNHKTNLRDINAQIQFKKNDDDDDDDDEYGGDDRNNNSMEQKAQPNNFLTNYNFKNNQNCKNQQLELVTNLK